MNKTRWRKVTTFYWGKISIQYGFNSHLWLDILGGRLQEVRLTMFTIQRPFKDWKIVIMEKYKVTKVESRLLHIANFPFLEPLGYLNQISISSPLPPSVKHFKFTTDWLLVLENFQTNFRFDRKFPKSSRSAATSWCIKIVNSSYSDLDLTTSSSDWWF